MHTQTILVSRLNSLLILLDNQKNILYINYQTLWILGMRISLQTLYLSDFSLSFHLMTSHHDRPGFSDFSISPDQPITLESYIFGYDIIHNSSINSTSHFLSVSCTFLTLLSTSPAFSLGITHHSPLSYICDVNSSRSVSLPCLQFTFFTVCRFRSRMIYRVIQCDSRSIDYLSEEGDFSGGGMG